MGEIKVQFELFRYQLLTTSQKQVPFLSGSKPADEVRENKNKYFWEALNSVKAWKDPLKRQDIISETLYSQDDFYICKIGVKKPLRYTDMNFKENVTDDWPHVTVVINNDPSVQIIAISPNPKAFTTSNRVSNILIGTLQQALKSYGLTILADPLFDKIKFWDIVTKNKGKISSVKFEMISPNISNIRETLHEQVLLARDECNANKTIVELQSDEDSSLTLDKDNDYISGMVDYSSEGGGEIRVKVRGKNVISTKKQPRKVSVSIQDEESQGDFFKEAAVKLFDKIRDIIK